jgi:hypothetical protein
MFSIIFIVLLSFLRRSRFRAACSTLVSISGHGFARFIRTSPQRYAGDLKARLRFGSFKRNHSGGVPWRFRSGRGLRRTSMADGQPLEHATHVGVE